MNPESARQLSFSIHLLSSKVKENGETCSAMASYRITAEFYDCGFRERRGSPAQIMKFSCLTIVSPRALSPSICTFPACSVALGSQRPQPKHVKVQSATIAAFVRAEVPPLRS